MLFNYCDCLDGNIARVMRTWNPYGRFLDSMMNWADIFFWTAVGAAVWHNPSLRVLPSLRPETWLFAGAIPPYDSPTSTSTAGYIGFSPAGSVNCFSYLYSPDVDIVDGILYRSQWTVACTVSDPDMASQFRLRINQKGAWTAWDMVVNSNLGHGPSIGTPRTYNLFFDPMDSMKL